MVAMVDATGISTPPYIRHERSQLSVDSLHHLEQPVQAPIQIWGCFVPFHMRRLLFQPDNCTRQENRG